MFDKTARDIIKEIGEWAANNWPADKHAPDLGIVEELGEATHCILKRIQKIRGFDNDNHFKEQLKDAFADAGIYLLHYCFKNALPLSFAPTGNVVVNSDRQFLSYAMRNAINLVDYEEVLDDNKTILVAPCAQRIWNTLFAWAQKYDIQLEDAVRSTWQKVSQRDWKQNPTDAHEKISS